MREMKDSGVEWIGDIPKEWTVLKYKNICNIQNGYPFDSNLFDTTEGFPLIRIRDITSGKIETFYKGTFSEQYIVKNDDILVGMDGDFNIRKWDNIDALLNQRCLKINGNTSEYKNFIYYQLPFELKKVNDLTYATTVKHLSHFSILNAKVVVPSLNEISRIVSFLDQKISLIDNIIEKTKQSIEEYKKLKQSIITEAVTKGLNPDVKMKDSGIEWIGMIPEHWMLGKMNKLVTINNGRDNIEKDGEIPVYGSGGIFGFTDKYLYEGESVLLGRKGTIDKPQYVDCRFWAVDTAFYTISINNTNMKFFYYLTTMIEFDLFKSGSILPSMTQTTLNDIKLPIPPTNEQSAIAIYLDKKCQDIDSFIVNKYRLIDDIESYKKSLIYEVVTGKKEIA